MIRGVSLEMLRFAAISCAILVIVGISIFLIVSENRKFQVDTKNKFDGAASQSDLTNINNIANINRTDSLDEHNQTTIYSGTSIDPKYFSNQAYTKVVNTHFLVVTPGNAMKWDATEPKPGVFTFEAADSIVKFAKENRKQIHGHTAVYHEQIPEWVKTLDAKGLVNATQNHIKTLLGRYAKDLDAFDVCNEVLDDDGKFRKTFWFEKLGESYIEIAFQAAVDAETGVRLYISDYNIEGHGKKSNALYELSKKLVEKKLLHGVGFQGHLNVGKLPTLPDLKSNLKRFVDLGQTES
ncbi:hypothetical protein CROQUDRAFT_707930 [Cronartium quercuum f. sp. fusiforme G11]|uniref:Beta-xylanase n=1 Tax=Cronartium quercuum f. sp. fusiforme G11 TaxID=708437 RepID=A0A9P6NIM7_9BASI|nr:hypothetical protein CROQUDRAFT_707930 [Cronartium quercuum f. sp. fusiforme G11]